MYTANEHKMSYLTQIYKSISSFEAYRFFAGRRIEKAFIYLLFLTITLGVLSLVRPLYNYNTGIKNFIAVYQKDVPDFELKNGELNVKSNEAIIYVGNGEIFVIDTTGKKGEDVLDRYNGGVFISRDKIVTKKNGFVESPLIFSDIPTLTLTKSDIESLLPLLKWVNLFIVVFGLIGFFVSKLFSILIISIISLIVCGISRFNTSYKTLLKLSFYAITLPIIVKIIVRMIGVEVPFFGILYYCLGAVYVWMAAKLLSSRDDAALGGDGGIELIKEND